MAIGRPITERRRAAMGAAYRWLWTSAALSNLADGVFKVGLPLVAIQVTRSPALIAGLTLALTLPWLVFALPAGALVDRLDRRRAMLGANGLRASLIAALVVATVLGVDSIWVLYLVAVGIGVAETVYDTSAQSIVPQIVPRDRLSRANGRLFAAQLAADQFVGPPLAGVLVAAGAAIAFLAPATAWVAAIAALLLVRGRFRVARERPTTVRADIAEGLRFVWRHRLLRTLATMVGTYNFASNATMAVLVLYAVGSGSAMGLSAQTYGILLSTMAAGSLLGSLVAERVERAFGRARSLWLAFLSAALLMGAPAVTTNPYAIGAGFLISSTGLVVANVILVSLRQRITPDRLLGRTNSVYRLVAWGTMPIGAAAGGVLAQLLGLRAVFLIMTVVALALLAGMAIVTDKLMNAAEAEAEAEAEAGSGSGSGTPPVGTPGSPSGDAGPEPPPRPARSPAAAPPPAGPAGPVRSG